MMSQKFRDISPHELAAFQVLAQTSLIGTMPIKFNGQDRYAIVVKHEGPTSPFIQIIGILVHEDTMTTAAGDPVMSLSLAEKTN